MMNRIPNLFIIGSMKSGTSSLHQYIDTHPDIFMSGIKEPMHFSQPENYTNRVSAYMALFADATTEKYVGESSTEYTKLPRGGNIPQRIYQFNPESKLIYLMRDPFDRIVSDYKHLVKSGITTLPFYEALLDDPQEVITSCYAYQLKPYFEVFGREAVYLDTFESMTQDPKSFCRRLFAWLGVDDSFVPPNLEEVANASPSQYVGKDFSGFGRQFLVRAKHNPLLRKLVPMSISRKVRLMLSKPVHFDFQSEAFKREVAEVQRILDPILLPWIDELQALTGLSFEGWKTAKRSAESLPEAQDKTRALKDAIDSIMHEASVSVE